MWAAAPPLLQYGDEEDRAQERQDSHSNRDLIRDLTTEDPDQDPRNQPAYESDTGVGHERAVLTATALDGAGETTGEAGYEERKDSEVPHCNDYVHWVPCRRLIGYLVPTRVDGVDASRTTRG